jgi:opacity protein-like surface antigen
MTTRRLIFVFSTLLFVTLMLNVSGARAEEGHHTFGVQGGQEGLTSDVSTGFSNALGIGAFFDYAASDYLEFELSWINSTHPGGGTIVENGQTFAIGTTNLVDNSFMLALQYDIDTYDIFTPYLKGGAEFATASVNIPGSVGNLSTTGFGLDIGVGSRVELGSNFMAGLDFMYHSMFTASATVPNSGGASVNLIESYYTVMLRLGFTFGSGGYHTGGAKPPPSN